MKILFDDIIKGLENQGYKIKGGGDLYCVLSKEDKEVKVFTEGKITDAIDSNKFWEPNHVVVRYSI